MKLRNTLPIRLLFLTDDCDAVRFGHLDHFVHQVLRPFSEVVPLEHTDRTVPHDLLGPADRLCVGLRALGSTVQTLQRRKECLTFLHSPLSSFNLK